MKRKITSTSTTEPQNHRASTYHSLKTKKKKKRKKETIGEPSPFDTRDLVAEVGGMPADALVEKLLLEAELYELALFADLQQRHGVVGLAGLRLGVGAAFDPGRHRRERHHGSRRRRSRWRFSGSGYVSKDCYTFYTLLCCYPNVSEIGCG